MVLAMLWGISNHLFEMAVEEETQKDIEVKRTLLKQIMTLKRFN